MQRAGSLNPASTQTQLSPSLIRRVEMATCCGRHMACRVARDLRGAAIPSGAASPAGRLGFRALIPAQGISSAAVSCLQQAAARHILRARSARSDLCGELGHHARARRIQTWTVSDWSTATRALNECGLRTSRSRGGRVLAQRTVCSNCALAAFRFCEDILRAVRALLWAAAP